MPKNLLPVLFLPKTQHSFPYTKKWQSTPLPLVLQYGRRGASSLRQPPAATIAAKRNTHQYLEPNPVIGSWEAPKNPEEALAKLALLRREYGKQVKAVRKEYIKEIELMRLEKQGKDEARREALRVANEERKKLKAEAAKVRAEERKIAEQEFRQMLLKERSEKLEHWRMKEIMREEKKKKNNDMLRQQSGKWIDESELEKMIARTVIDNATQL